MEEAPPVDGGEGGVSDTEDEAKAPAERGTPPRDDGPSNSSTRAGSNLLPDLRVDEKQHGDPCEGHPVDAHQPEKEEAGARHPPQHQEASGGGDSRSEEEGEES